MIREKNKRSERKEKLGEKNKRSERKTKDQREK